MMKVLYICTYFHEALLYRQQLDGLNKRGHDVYAFNSAKYGSTIADKFKNVFDYRVKHVECWNNIDRQLFFPRQHKIHQSLLNSYNPKDFELIHAHLLVTSGLSARKIKNKYGVPYVVSVRTTDLIGWIRLPFFRQMALKNAQDASGLLFLSENHRNEFFEKYVSQKNKEELYLKSVIIGNPLEKFWEDNILDIPKQLSESGTVNILTVARINKVKNIPLACQGVSMLRERGYNATFTVIGAVEDVSELKKIEGFDFVRIIPYLEKEDLIKFYRKNDIFLLPSKIETFGRVYVEAMSQGLPVIYTRGQGFDGVFDEGVVGYSVGANAPNEIADCIERILANYINISSNCIKLCKNYFEENILSEIEGFYQSALIRAENGE